MHMVERAKPWPLSGQILKQQVGLHQFSEVSSSWILKALECIGQCVEVDPNKRPRAIWYSCSN